MPSQPHLRPLPAGATRAGRVAALALGVTLTTGAVGGEGAGAEPPAARADSGATSTTRTATSAGTLAREGDAAALVRTARALGTGATAAVTLDATLADSART